LFIYTGGESEEWVEDVLADKESKTRVICLLESIENPFEEEVVDGMQEEEEEDGEDEAEEGEDEEEVEYDEHVWLSLKNAVVLVTEIKNKICEIDEKNADDYRANANGYIALLQALDTQYESAVNNPANTHNTVLFADRFPFRYMSEDYGFSYYGAFVGCSAETEASVETIAFLTVKVNELNISKILVLENTSCDFAQTIINSSTAKNQTVLEMNSLQSISKNNIKDGISYLSVMQKNLVALTQALA
jgi:zinc transport system substrate-binding protein